MKVLILLCFTVIVNCSENGYQDLSKYRGMNYYGKFEGKCGYDGLYYKDVKNFIFCSNGISYVQPCPKGTHNSGYKNFQKRDTYNYRDFCDVNLNYKGGANYSNDYDKKNLPKKGYSTTKDDRQYKAEPKRVYTPPVGVYVHPIGENTTPKPEYPSPRADMAKAYPGFSDPKSMYPTLDNDNDASKASSDPKPAMKNDYSTTQSGYMIQKTDYQSPKFDNAAPKAVYPNPKTNNPKPDYTTLKAGHVKSRYRPHKPGFASRKPSKPAPKPSYDLPKTDSPESKTNYPKPDYTTSKAVHVKSRYRPHKPGFASRKPGKHAPKPSYDSPEYIKDADYNYEQKATYTIQTTTDMGYAKDKEDSGKGMYISTKRRDYDTGYDTSMNYEEPNEGYGKSYHYERTQIFPVETEDDYGSKKNVKYMNKRGFYKSFDRNSYGRGYRRH